MCVKSPLSVVSVVSAILPACRLQTEPAFAESCPVPGFVARVPEDDDLAPPHPDRAAARCGPDHVPRVPLDHDSPARHFGSDPVGGVAFHDDLPAGHLRAQMHADRPMYHDPAVGHPGPDVLDPAEIAGEPELPRPPSVGGALHLEKLTEVRPSGTVGGVRSVKARLMVVRRRPAAPSE